MKGKVAANIDEYIFSFPAEVQDVLRLVRGIVRKTAPKATETIKYGMPTYVQNGNLVYFAAYKKHIGFYPVPANGTLEKEMAPYKQGKGSIQFPLDKPMPLELIVKLVKWKLKRDSEKIKIK